MLFYQVGKLLGRGALSSFNCATSVCTSSGKIFGPLRVSSMPDFLYGLGTVFQDVLSGC